MCFAVPIPPVRAANVQTSAVPHALFPNRGFPENWRGQHSPGSGVTTTTDGKPSEGSSLATHALVTWWVSPIVADRRTAEDASIGLPSPPHLKKVRLILRDSAVTSGYNRLSSAGCGHFTNAANSCSTTEDGMSSGMDIVKPMKVELLSRGTAVDDFRFDFTSLSDTAQGVGQHSLICHKISWSSVMVRRGQVQNRTRD